MPCCRLRYAGWLNSGVKPLKETNSVQRSVYQETYFSLPQRFKRTPCHQAVGRIFTRQQWMATCRWWNTTSEKKLTRTTNTPRFFSRHGHSVWWKAIKRLRTTCWRMRQIQACYPNWTTSRRCKLQGSTVMRSSSRYFCCPGSYASKIRVARFGGAGFPFRIR